MNLHSVRLEREDEWEEFCHDRIEQAEEIIADIIAKLGSS